MVARRSDLAISFPVQPMRCWECVTCPRLFLRYTEYGGYYEDARIRELNAGLVDVGT